MSRAAIFLDRDGTLNVEKEYVHKVEDWEWIPKAIDAIRLINALDYLAIVVTNQSGIARGYYRVEDVHRLHSHVDECVQVEDARIDAYYFCPHHPDFGPKQSCFCRKPKPGLLLKARQDFDIDIRRSWIVGDKRSDVEAGLRAGVTPILVRTGYGAAYGGDDLLGVRSEPDVYTAIEFIRNLTPHS